MSRQVKSQFILQPFIVPVDVSVLAEQHLADISIARLSGQVQSGPGLIFTISHFWKTSSDKFEFVQLLTVIERGKLQPGLLVEHIDQHITNTNTNTIINSNTNTR